MPPGQAQARVDLDALFTRVAMDVILRTLFSSQAADDTADAAHAVQALSETAMREMFWPLTLPDWLALPGKAAKRHAMRRLRGLVARHLQARATEPADTPRQDLLSMLLALRDDATGAALSPQEVFDQCMVSFQAGHETSATALLWWSLLMARHPAAAARAQAEVDTVLAGRAPGPDDLAALPWLTATLKETLRLYPPVAAVMTRRTTAPLQLGRWQIPAGALLRFTPWVLQRDSRHFEDPSAFRPGALPARSASAAPRRLDAFRRGAARVHRPAFRDAGDDAGGGDADAALQPGRA